MRWISNTYDPKAPNADSHVIQMFDQTQCEVIAAYHLWLADKIIGEPKATEVCSVAVLRAMNMVGVYVLDKEDDSD